MRRTHARCSEPKERPFLGQAVNIEDALNSEYFFYSRVFGFECVGDDVKPFDIDNLE